MISSIRSIALRHFDGDRRTGPRHGYLLRELRRRGLNPWVDRHRNIWVERGEGPTPLLISAHIDVDPSVPQTRFEKHREGRRTILSGVLDNALGCYLGLELLRCRIPKELKLIFVFTASEEVHRTKPHIFARSAREVVRELRHRRIRPALCIAVDVTYPRLQRPAHRMDWKDVYHALFDPTDRTHCYLDGYTHRKARRLGVALLRRFGRSHVGIRSLAGHDEAHVYRRLAPSFAFGPVVYGSFDQPYQRMPLVHAKTALVFLKSVLHNLPKVL